MSPSPKRKALHEHLVTYTPDEVTSDAVEEVLISLHDLLVLTLPVEEADAIWHKMNDLAEYHL